MKQFKIFPLVLVFLCAFFQNVSLAQGLNTQDPGKMVADYYSGIDAANTKALIRNLLADDFSFSAPFSPVALDKKGWTGIVQGFKSAFPDGKHDILDWFADGNKVSVQGIYKGTNTGSLMGNPPTGNRVALPFNALLELDGKGKIKMCQVQFDQKSFEAQLMAGMDPNAKMEMAKKNIVTAYDALNRRDWAAFSDLCTPAYTEWNVGPAPAVGINAALDLYKQFQTAFPDFMVKIKDIAAVSTNRYLVRVTVTGTNTGPFMLLPPTGKSIHFEDADVVEFDNSGKCISHAVTNVGESLRQIGYGSMLNPGTQTVIAVYEKFGKGDIPGILANATDDVVFDIQDRIFDSKGRTFKGKAEVGKFFQELGSKFAYTKFQPIRFVADGDDVFVLIDVEYTQLASGKKYVSTYTHHFKVVNGKVTYFRGVDDFPVLK